MKRGMSLNTEKNLNKEINGPLDHAKNAIPFINNNDKSKFRLII